MDAILSFFSSLILFTAGLAVFIFWVILFGLIAVEVYDWVTGDKTNPDNEPEEQ